MQAVTKQRIRAEIRRLVVEHQQRPDMATQWRPALVGFASADDPLFEKLREVATPSHAHPRDLLPGARTVVAFFIPLDRSIAQRNIRSESASREWAQAYIETNTLIEEVGQHMQRLLGPGEDAVAVTPATHNFDAVRLVSDWSHRHVAFIAGLGRFGVNNMLITESGCCGRWGSFITSLELEPDARPEEESCLHRDDSSCLACVGRCPSEALSADGFDRQKCYATCLKNEERWQALGKADVCGKCLVGVPCTLGDPVTARRMKKGSGAGGDGEVRAP